MSKFTKVLDDLEELRSARLDAERDAYGILMMAKRRLKAAELESDMRTWSEEERDEYVSALAEYSEAYDQWAAAKAAL